MGKHLITLEYKAKHRVLLPKAQEIITGEIPANITLDGLLTLISIAPSETFVNYSVASPALASKNGYPYESKTDKQFWDERTTEAYKELHELGIVCGTDDDAVINPFRREQFIVERILRQTRGFGDLLRTSFPYAGIILALCAEPHSTLTDLDEAVEERGFDIRSIYTDLDVLANMNMVVKDQGMYSLAPHHAPHADPSQLRVF